MLDLKVSVDSSVMFRRLGSINNRIIPYVGISFKKFVELAEAKIVAYTPRTQEGRTDIKKLWRVTHSRKGRVESFIIHNIYPKKEVLIFIEEGTRPHTIFPVRTKALHFYWRGSEVFTKRVDHPGTEGAEMVGRTEKELNSMVNFYINDTERQIDKLWKEGLR